MQFLKKLKLWQKILILFVIASIIANAGSGNENARQENTSNAISASGGLDTGNEDPPSKEMDKSKTNTSPSQPPRTRSRWIYIKQV